MARHLWEQVQQLFDAALQQPPEKRQEFLEQACGSNQELRREVESLLAAHDKPGSFMAEPALAGMAEVLHRATSRFRPGDTLGVYKVLDLVGCGGMGEVYRARDLKLKREVAIKLLPDEFSRDPDRVARFQREAEVLASLNHPNIAAIYHLEEANGSRFLVLELVEGETLAERIKRGPIPADEALSIAKKICEALEAAHEKSVVHRDLKPANVKITPEGKVKVLDFGLAKAFEADASNATLSNSPTLSMAATNAGVILGTAAYMSPEQARGRTVDKRTDIWSFGCVLFEILTGQPLFGGETVSDTIARILERPLSLDTLPAATPTVIRSLLRRCLKKEARERLHDIADARIEIEDAIAAPAPAESVVSISNSKQRLMAIGLISALALVLAVVVIALSSLKPAKGSGATQFPILLPEGQTAAQVVVSPDGRQLAIVAWGQVGSIWIRPFDSTEPKRLVGSENAVAPLLGLVWSPDSRSIAFWSRDGKLRRMDVADGTPLVLSDFTVDVFSGGGSWNADGIILFGAGNSIRRVSASGGSASDVDLEDQGGKQAVRSLPQFLTDGRHFLYFVSAPGHRGELRVGSLDSKTTSLVPNAEASVYSKDGHLLFMRGTTLMAQQFDVRNLVLIGEAKPVTPKATPGYLSGSASFSTSENGVLAYVTTRAGKDGQLTWFDRSGKALGSIKQPPGVEYLNPSLSPDEKRLAVNSMDQAGNWDIWVVDLQSQIASRLTSDPAQDSDAIWSPDGREVAFVSNRSGSYGIYKKAVRGADAEELLLKTEFEPRATDWTRDGFIIYEMIGNIMALPLVGENRKPFTIAATKFNEYGAKTSADGKWIAYASEETGQHQIYVQPFPGPGEKKPVSTEVGYHPRWRADGRELFYYAAQGVLMSVDLRYDGAGVQASSPKPVLPPHIKILDLLDARHQHAITADGQRFLLRQPLGPPGPPINVILNWTEALPK